MVDADFNFKMPKIEMTEQSEDGKYGRFVVEPLERGYGLTLGNSFEKNYAFIISWYSSKQYQD